MNVFLVGWNLPKSCLHIAKGVMKKIKDIYPQLDERASWEYNSQCGTLSAFGMNSADEFFKPRVYKYQDDDQIVFYSGLPIDISERFLAHNAKELSKNWDSLSKNIEGKFSLIKISKKPLKLELITDRIGSEQIYYRYNKDSWSISNSVYLLEKINDCYALDSVGVMMFLNMEWVGSDRTLREGIKVFSGGLHLTWSNNNFSPVKRLYFDISKISTRKKDFSKKADIENLINNLLKPIKIISQSFGAIRSQLTGGLDSRLVLALNYAGGINAKYYTMGEPDSEEIKIASAIAQSLNIPYEILKINTDDIVENWDILVKNLMLQNDGLVSLWHIVDIFENIQRVKNHEIILNGYSGTIGKATYLNTNIFLKSINIKTIQKIILEHHNRDFCGIINNEAKLLTADYVNTFIMDYFSKQFEPGNILDLFLLLERIRRWEGNNSRKIKPLTDFYSPLQNMEFIKSAFCIPPIKRVAAPLHSKLMNFILPMLYKLPSNNKRWKVQYPTVYLTRAYITAKMKRLRYRLVGNEKKSRNIIPVIEPFNHFEWFLRKRQTIREVCLDQNNSKLWDYIDKYRFNELMSLKPDINAVRRNIKIIYRIATLFYYEYFSREN